MKKKETKEQREKKQDKRRRIREIRKGKKEGLRDRIQSGHTAIQVRLEELNNQARINEAYKRLLSPLVKDEKILEIVIKNKDKLRNRFSYEIQIEGEKNKQTVHVGKIYDIGNRTIEEMKNTYQDKLRYKKGRQLEQGIIPSDAALLGLPIVTGKQIGRAHV